MQTLAVQCKVDRISRLETAFLLRLEGLEPPTFGSVDRRRKVASCLYAELYGEPASAEVATESVFQQKITSGLQLDAWDIPGDNSGRFEYVGCFVRQVDYPSSCRGDSADK